MKTAIIIHDNIKQIVLTPESDSDKEVCRMFTPDKAIDLAIHKGTLYDNPYSHRVGRFGVDIAMCQGNYLRAYDNQESVMLILSPSQKNPDQSEYIKELLDKIANLESQLNANKEN